MSTAFSPDVVKSLTECKQLVLLLLVPLTYEIVDEGSAVMLTTIILVAGGCSALIGIGQYSFLHYDNLDLRARSTLGLYMTFSGLIMLVLNVALARLLFLEARSGMWPALPAARRGKGPSAVSRPSRLPASLPCSPPA